MIKAAFELHSVDSIEPYKFVNKYLNPALKIFSPFAVYVRWDRASLDKICIDLAVEKSKSPIKRLNLNAIVDQARDAARRVVLIGSDFYRLEDRVDDNFGQYVIAQGANPILKVEILYVTRGWNNIKVSDFNRGKLEYDINMSNEEYSDEDSDAKGRVKLEFTGQNSFLNNVYYKILKYYANNKKAKFISG